jgi:hypothetical protein
MVMAGEAREILRLHWCPRCNYDLTGLPAAHRCPECGFEYDETMFDLPVVPTREFPPEMPRTAFRRWLITRLIVYPTLLIGAFCVAARLGVPVIPSVALFVVSVAFMIGVVGWWERRARRNIEKRGEGETQDERWVLIWADNSGLKCSSGMTAHNSAALQWADAIAVQLEPLGDERWHLTIGHKRRWRYGIVSIRKMCVLACPEVRARAILDRIERMIAANGRD